VQRSRAASACWLVTALLCLAATTRGADAPPVGPYDAQLATKLRELDDSRPAVRAKAAEALGVMRAFRAEAALAARLKDTDGDVRRQAALALAWTGGRPSIDALLAALDDDDWSTRQAAHVALMNLTGMEFPFDGLGDPSDRVQQAAAWRQWWSHVPADHLPDDVLRLLDGPRSLTSSAEVTASTTYRGPPDVLLDGDTSGRSYWQTKNVPFPQWCQIDLHQTAAVSQVVVHQYGPGYCMTEFELSASLDGKTFETIVRRKGLTPPQLTIDLPSRMTRFLRVTSYNTEKKLYPTTFYEIQIFGPTPARPAARPGTLALSPAEIAERQRRGTTAVGALGGTDAAAALLDLLGPAPRLSAQDRLAMRAAIRGLGRLGGTAAREYLVKLLDQPLLARYAAEALGDLGDRRAVPALLRAYPRYARRLDGKDPVDLPRDDKMSFPSEDRMLETPFYIALALCRLPLDRPEDRQQLRRLAPQILANLSGDHDTFVLYQPEVGQLLTRYLLEQAGLRQEAVEYALTTLAQPRRIKAATAVGPWPIVRPARRATWLPALCTDPADLPRLLPLLDHDDGWVRINAAKAIAFLGDRRAIPRLAEILRTARPEADFGAQGLFKDEEFDDPCPRWREAIVRALGVLKAVEYVPLLAAVMNDERSVLEVRHAAAEALVDLDAPAAYDVLRRAAVEHPYHTVRNVARDALWTHHLSPETPPASADAPLDEALAQSAMTWPAADFDALVFLKGDNDLPNSKRTVEQADRWRQTYAVTDEGPVYRPADNLYVLRPPRPDGRVTPLTRFADGYVAEPEVSWDGRQVIFTHRGQHDPWWHVWRVNADGSGLVQLTHGPYHDVGPNFLPDGRIVFGSSRGGVRDEYHGYLCTPLHVMQPDGSDIHPIATNIGRDNEPALLPDGRIVFSRLEVFYSRNKTELTLHAARPDGAGDVVLYGPERRQFWRALDHGLPGPDDGQESPLTHRVLRMTQPQALPGGGIVVSTQGGLTLLGPRRDGETLLMPDFKTRAYTTPLPLADGSLLCAATDKTPDRKKVDLGIYRYYPATQKLELIYNDPATADYEARPLVARRPPPLRPPLVSRTAFSGRFLCGSVFHTQEAEVSAAGRLVRLIEGTPVVGRHATHTGSEPVWKNHGGTLGRVLGTAPLAADGSFCVELPADRLVHLQVLDSDRRVVGNQLTWIYVRPGETKSCVGCHENPHATPSPAEPLALRAAPLKFLPTGGEFAYRAKAWFKGSLPAEIEERTRTVHAVNLFGRP